MTSETSIRRFCIAVCYWAVLFFSLNAAGQRAEDSCDAFFDNPHQTLDCLEAVFTQTDIQYHSLPLPHLTLSSIPPGNGFPIGLVYEKRTNHVSSPFSATEQTNTPSTGYKSLVDAKLASGISTNASWYITGSVSWLPPLHYREESRPGSDVCHRLWLFCTKQVLGVNFSVTHRVLQNISFNGLGPLSPNTQLSFRQIETYGGATARMPLFSWLTVEGQIENRKPTITFSTSSLNSGMINNTSTPGFATQPDFMHYGAGIRISAQAISEPVTNDPPATPAGLPPPPLMKHKWIFILNNASTEHWFVDQDNGAFSFRQFVFDGTESMKLHSVIRRFVPPSKMTTSLKFLRHFCNQRKTGFKADDECDFGEFAVRPRLILSDVNSGMVPFYLQPTLGGADIESRLTLRGFNDYRFRAPDAAMLGVDYGIPVFNPIGALLFYDAGTVGNAVSDLSFTHARQDGGVGATLRLQGNVVAQIYLAFGAGHGSHFGYNFTKFF